MTGIANVNNSAEKSTATSDVEKGEDGSSEAAVAVGDKNASFVPLVKIADFVDDGDDAKSERNFNWMYNRVEISKKDTENVSLLILSCMFVSVIEVVLLFYMVAQLGFEDINTSLFWMEATFVSAALAVSVTAWCGVKYRSSALLVPFLMLFLPRITLPTVSYLGMFSSLFGVAHTLWMLLYFYIFLALFVWLKVHRYHRQLARAEAVDTYLKKQILES